MGFVGVAGRFWAFIIIWVFMILVSATEAMAGDSAAEPFSEPGYRVEMPSGWAERSLVYKNVDGDVKLSVLINQQLSAVLLPIVDRFASERDVRISVEIGTCGISAGALSRREVDLGGFCCPPGKIDRMPGLRYHTLGITPLLLLVHKNVGVDNVSLEEARKLFRGEIRNWSELGGGDIPVKPMGMLHCKKRPGHWRLILGNADDFSPEFRVTGDINDTIEMVASTKGSIGFEIIMNLLKLGKMDDVKILRIDGHDPMDLGWMKTNGYPFYRTMNVTTWAGPDASNPLAEELVKYMHKETEKLDPSNVIVPASELREAGWKFSGDELTGEPGK